MAQPLTDGSSPSTRWVGIESVSAGEGRAVLRMAARQEMTNRAGVVHGGFIALLADSAMGHALRTVLPDGERHMSFDLKTSFISPGRIGESLEAVGTVLHSGRRTGVAECRVTGDGGRLVATASATFVVARPDPAQSEG